MFIRKKRIRSLSAYISNIPIGAEFHPVVELDEASLKKLPRIGFSTEPASGDTILPNVVGPISRFNTDGKWQIHRDQPKEKRYIRTVRWTWKQWAGRGQYEEHEDFRDIYRRCYPRSLIPVPGVELTYIEKDDKILIVAPALRNLDKQHPDVLHSVNLLLELFGVCELVKADLGSFSNIKVKRLNWQLLPPGKYPWVRLKGHLDEVLKRMSENTQSVIFDRQETILSFNPDEQFVGKGGFSDYISYVFKDRGLVVLESIRKGNAIYVFGLDWDRFSKLTKSEIINANLHLARLVHTKGWKTKIAQLLDDRKTA
ncbi:hypothetical protein [Sneathiella glossodoripedis]|uniref:hypothetical protein n=1 Tax=Sneathiella glossodoripedis TaxID=418853 RepID=UPI00046F3312|nr:hypothetical protein [Sneathiella glossodoripedis]